MIQSFADRQTRKVFMTGTSRQRGHVARTAARRLHAVDFAGALEDFRHPPGKRLEKLKGDREGQWSVPVNDRFRIRFRWDGKDAWQVEIVDDR